MSSILISPFENVSHTNTSSSCYEEENVEDLSSSDLLSKIHQACITLQTLPIKDNRIQLRQKLVEWNRKQIEWANKIVEEKTKECDKLFKEFDLKRQQCLNLVLVKLKDEDLQFYELEACLIKLNDTLEELKTSKLELELNENNSPQFVFQREDVNISRPPT
ncbi:unnamed protein product, partial [Didymodactylos carnosus]